MSSDARSTPASSLCLATAAGLISLSHRSSTARHGFSSNAAAAIAARRSISAPSSSGVFGPSDAPPYAVFYDLWRLEDGLIVEHWDNVEPVPPREEWANSGKF